MVGGFGVDRDADVGFVDVAEQGDVDRGGAGRAERVLGVDLGRADPHRHRAAGQVAGEKVASLEHLGEGEAAEL